MAIVDVLQTEKESLVQQIQTMERRLNEDRNRCEQMQEQIRKQNIKFSRLEFKYSKKNIRIQKYSIYVFSCRFALQMNV